MATANAGHGRPEPELMHGVKRGAIAGRALSAAGRSSANPATARKAEKKKRGEAARTLANSFAAAGNSFDDLCAGLQHSAVYTGGMAKAQAPKKKPSAMGGLHPVQKGNNYQSISIILIYHYLDF